MRIYDGATYVGTAEVSGTTWTFADTRTLSDTQSVSYTARVADLAGNMGKAGTAYTAKVDTFVASATVTAITDNVGIITGTVLSGGVTDDRNLVVSGTLSKALVTGDVVAIFDGVTKLGNATVSGTTWTYTDTRTHAHEKALSYTAQVVDAVGNTSTSAAYTATVDIVAPEKTAAVTSIVDDFGIFTGPVSSTGITDDTSLSLTGTLSAALATGETVRIYDGATYLANAVMLTETTWTFTDTRTLTNAKGLSYTARVTDAAGNMGVAGTAYTATIDTSAPTKIAAVTVVTDNVGSITGTVAKGGATNDTNLTLSGTLSAALTTGETVRIYDGATYVGTAEVSGTTWTFADTRTHHNGSSFCIWLCSLTSSRLCLCSIRTSSFMW